VEKHNKYLATVLEQEELVTKLVEAKTNKQQTPENDIHNIKLLDQQWIKAKIEAE